MNPASGPNFRAAAIEPSQITSASASGISRNEYGPPISGFNFGAASHSDQPSS